ncbi:lactate dehydrogenase-like 2-hydroxyacid dehydrogenase [Pedobacter sp. UYP30]|uniref:hypothetical protein n=1 Tax=Pedobacter sp. UYP30 TaxID=1756400 RepID=UPI003395434F
MKAIAFNISPEQRDWLAIANLGKHHIKVIAKKIGPNSLSAVKGMDVLLDLNNSVINSSIVRILALFGVKYIATSAENTNNIDLKAAARMGIEVANLRFLELDPKHRFNQTIANINLWAACRCMEKVCCQEISL